MQHCFKRGNKIERKIEDFWFSAVVIEVNSDAETIDLKYLDDGNEEEHVPLKEIREFRPNYSSEETVFLSIRDTLRRPLAGLVEDDYEVRKQHKPTVTLHHLNTSDEAIIMNGAENKQAAGGGLRALRYLKK